MARTGSARRDRPALSRERVLRTAVALADEAGVAALTMRKLADRLGVEAMSLYYYVTDKEEILDGMVDLVFDEIDLPAEQTDWKAAMRARAFSARDAMLRHPWAVGLMESRISPGPATLRHHDAVLGAFLRAGFPIPMAAHAVSLIDSYVYGFVMQAVNLPFDSGEQAEQVAASMAVPADTYPHLARMIEYATTPGYAYRNEFEFGLDLVLDGLDRLVSESRLHGFAPRMGSSGDPG